MPYSKLGDCGHPLPMYSVVISVEARGPGKQRGFAEFQCCAICLGGFGAFAFADWFRAGAPDLQLKGYAALSNAFRETANAAILEAPRAL